MAFPDFSEFTFGYTVVRQIEEVLGGQTVAPSFPTQPEEASLGYDVSFLENGVPLFIQLKRSEVMQRRSCLEYKDMNADFKLPIFRMHLHPSRRFQQHYLMQRLEIKGNIAVYCTSAVENKNALDALYSDGQVFDATTFFSPLEIILPSWDTSHHVSFCRASREAWVYSSNGVRFNRHTVTFDDVLARLRAHRDVSWEAQRELFRDLVDEFDQLGSEEMAHRERFRHRLAQPSPDTDNLISLESAATREGRRQRTRDIESVVKRAAIEAYFEADAMLVSIPKKELG